MNQELQKQISLQKENDKWKKLLQSNLFNLCKCMDPGTGLIDCLSSEKVMNNRAAERCRTEAVRYDKNRAILDSVMRRSFDDFVKFCNSLCSTGQIHIVQAFFNPEIITFNNGLAAVAEGPVDVTDAASSEAAVATFDWREFIRKNLMVLIDVIDPDSGLIEALANRNVIPGWVTDRYKNRGGRSSRVEDLLLDLIRKGDNDYKKFCEALKEVNQQHVVDDYLARGSVGCYRHNLRRSKTYSEDIAASGESHVLCNWKDIFVRQQSDLIENIASTRDLINHLEKTGVMNRRSAERCQEIVNEHDRTLFILDFMRMRPDRDFSYFRQGLILTDQEHIVNTYFKVDENVSAAVQESTSAPTTPLGQLEIGDAVGDGGGGQLEEEDKRQIVGDCLHQPSGDGDFCQNNLGEGGQRVDAGKENLVVAVDPAKENIEQPVQEEPGITINLIEDGSAIVKRQETEHACDDMGYCSCSQSFCGQNFDEGRLPPAAADAAAASSSSLQPSSTDNDDSLYGSCSSSIIDVNTCHSSLDFCKKHHKTATELSETLKVAVGTPIH